VFETKKGKKDLNIIHAETYSLNINSQTLPGSRETMEEKQTVPALTEVTGIGPNQKSKWANAKWWGQIGQVTNRGFREKDS
jgi:hypothetical protein